MIDKDVNEKINQLLNNGFAFPEHLTSKERDEVEQGLLSWYNKYAISAFIEEEMIYTVDSSGSIILTMEITKNSIYFNPREHFYLLDVIVTTLEFITDKLVKTEPSSPLPEDDDSTEEMIKEKPNFDFL